METDRQPTALGNARADQAPTCGDCEKARIKPTSPFYNFGCMECRARSIASSPAFFESVQANAITPTYRSALRCHLASLPLAEAHEMVKRYARSHA